MSQFKVGDLVQIVAPPESKFEIKSPRGIFFVGDMRRYDGGEFMVALESNGGYFLNGVSYCWDPEWLRSTTIPKFGPLPPIQRTSTPRGKGTFHSHHYYRVSDFTGLPPARNKTLLLLKGGT